MTRSAESDLYPAFRERLDRLRPRPRRMIAACSGGPDSMALLDLAARYAAERKVFLAAAHVDHGLRGRGSRADAAFVRREAKKRRLPCDVARVDVATDAARSGRGIEETGRRLRYEALARAARQKKCPVVLTAHNQNDQVETVFLHLIRGAGAHGLAGMAEVSRWPVAEPGRPPRLVRPLLCVRRDRITRYLRARGVPFRTDPSNADARFFRNFLRPTLLRWETARPGFFDRVARLAEIVRDEDDFWRKRLPAPGGFRRSGRRLILDLRRFLSYHKAEQRRILRLFFHLPDFGIVEKVRALARARAGAVPVPGGWVEKTAAALIFHRKARVAAPRNARRPFASPHTASSQARLPVPGRVRYPTRSAVWRFRTRFVSRLPAGWKNDPRRVFIDGNRLSGPALLCRSWRPGDRFRPLGLKGSKKLQDLFTDARVPRAQRADVPVLEDGRGIVWVAGLRISDAVKLSPGTRRVVEISAARRPA